MHVQWCTKQKKAYIFSESILLLSSYRSRSQQHLAIFSYIIQGEGETGNDTCDYCDLGHLLIPFSEQHKCISCSICVYAVF